ncbi:Pkinase-domain-containing protein, partial [Wilcoxina mikolae CBS 423.85]
QGLDIMAQLDFTHRDLKPQNIFVLSKSPSIWVKIADFGLSKRLIGDTVLRTQAYTKNYAAPEVCGFEYTNSVDIWSVGVITYEILTKKVPFRNDVQLVHYLNIKQASQSAVSFIKRLLAPMPSDRPTAEECLDDVWLNNSNETVFFETGGRTFYPDYEGD